MGKCNDKLGKEQYSEINIIIWNRNDKMGKWQCSEINIIIWNRNDKVRKEQYCEIVGKYELGSNNNHGKNVLNSSQKTAKQNPISDSKCIQDACRYWEG